MADRADLTHWRTTQEGETLGMLANFFVRYNRWPSATTIRELIAANPGLPFHDLPVGTTIHVPAYLERPAPPVVDQPELFEPEPEPDPEGDPVAELTPMTSDTIGARFGSGTTVTMFDKDGPAPALVVAADSLLDGDPHRIVCTRASIDWKQAGIAAANLRGAWHSTQGGRAGAFAQMANHQAELGNVARFSQMYPIGYGFANEVVDNLKAMIGNRPIVRNAKDGGSTIRAHDAVLQHRQILVEAHERHAVNGVGLFSRCQTTFTVWEACMRWTPYSAWRVFEQTGNVDLFVEAWETVTGLMDFGPDLPIRWAIGVGRPGMVERPEWPGVAAMMVDALMATGRPPVELENDSYRRNSHVADVDGVRARISPPLMLDAAYGPEWDEWIRLATKHDLSTSLGEWAIECDDPNYLLWTARRLWQHGRTSDGSSRFRASQYFFKPGNQDSSYNIVAPPVENTVTKDWTPFHPEASAMFKRLFVDLEDPFTIDYLPSQPMDPNAPWTDDEGAGTDAGNNERPGGQ